MFSCNLKVECELYVYRTPTRATTVNGQLYLHVSVYLSLATASLTGNAAVARVLIEHGASVNLTNADGQTPLILAALGGHEELITALLEAGADVNAKTPHGLTALEIANSQKHNVSVIDDDLICDYCTIHV